jgi:lysophospholipase L1-like esterase
MKRNWYFIVFCLMALSFPSCLSVKPQFFSARNELIRYTGRIDFRNPELPRIWQPGVYIEAAFIGTSCEFIVHDQVLWGSNHNYLQVTIDDTLTYRVQTKSAIDTIRIARNLKPGKHRITICKNTEANIGYIKFGGFIATKLVRLPPPPSRKIEFIGNSITCGAGADLSGIPCDKGAWHDQHNSWLSYGPLTARKLNAQWHVSAVSGIGLIHSCCDMKITMPQVFDKVEQRGDSILWDFSRYTPDVVSVCLGQNDGIQDSVAFCGAYVQFVKRLRVYYPNAQIFLLSSPMADEQLFAVTKRYLTGVVNSLNQAGDSKVDKYFYKKRYIGGCGWHPNLAEHEEISKELTDFIKMKMGW